MRSKRSERTLSRLSTEGGMKMFLLENAISFKSWADMSGSVPITYILTPCSLSLCALFLQAGLY